MTSHGLPCGTPPIVTRGKIYITPQKSNPWTLLSPNTPQLCTSQHTIIWFLYVMWWKLYLSFINVLNGGRKGLGLPWPHTTPCDHLPYNILPFQFSAKKNRNGSAILATTAMFRARARIFAKLSAKNSMSTN